MQKIVETMTKHQREELADAMHTFKQITSSTTLRLPTDDYFSSPVNVTANEVKAVMQVCMDAEQL